MDSFSQNTERLAEEYGKTTDFPGAETIRGGFDHFVAGRNSAKAELEEALRILAEAVAYYADNDNWFKDYEARFGEFRLIDDDDTSPVSSRQRLVGGKSAREAQAKVTSLLGFWPSDKAKGNAE